MATLKKTCSSAKKSVFHVKNKEVLVKATYGSKTPTSRNMSSLPRFR